MPTKKTVSKVSRKKSKTKPKARVSGKSARAAKPKRKATVKAGGNIAKYAERIRKYAMSFPDTREDFPWGHSAFKVNNKIFVSMTSDKDLRLSVKLTVSQFAALSLPFTEPTHYGMGKHGWVTAKFGPEVVPPLGLLESWIDESFRAIAPKGIQEKLDATR